MFVCFLAAAVPLCVGVVCVLSRCLVVVCLSPSLFFALLLFVLGCSRALQLEVAHTHHQFRLFALPLSCSSSSSFLLFPSIFLALTLTRTGPGVPSTRLSSCLVASIDSLTMSARALRACVKGLLLLVLFLSAFASQYRFYDLLEIDRSASQRDIKRAFRKMALKLHPDKANDKEAAQRLFVELVEAYETLEDPAKRRSYDQNPHAFHPSPSRSGDGASEQPSAEDHQRRYDEAQTKYNQFFSKLQQSFNEYVRRQEANNWESTGDGSDESFDFEFGDLWDGADEEELGQFKSLYGQHLKTHYSTHEKAVREVRCVENIVCQWWLKPTLKATNTHTCSAFSMK